MKSGWSSFFPCTHCGAQNVTGAGYCGSCGINLYYNCPDCQGWVDVTSSDCPNCGTKLDWPVGDAFRDKPSSSTIMLLLLGIVMLAIGSIYLIVNNSGSANAVSNKMASAPASEPASNRWPPVNALQPLLSYQNNSSVTGNENTPDSPDYDSISASQRDLPSYDVVFTFPAGTPPVTDTTPPSRSYLDTVYPNWGRCVGGRCNANIQ